MADHESAISAEDSDAVSIVSVDRTTELPNYLTVWAGGKPPSEWNAATAANAVIYAFLTTPVNGGVETVDNPTFATLISKGVYQKWPVRTTGKERCSNGTLVEIRGLKAATQITRKVLSLEGIKEVISTGHNPLVHWRHVPKETPTNTNTNEGPSDPSVPKKPVPAPAAFSDEQIKVVAKLIDSAIKKRDRGAKRQREAKEEDQEDEPPKKKQRAKPKAK